MGVDRPFRRIDLRRAKRDYAGLDLAPEPVALLELKRVVAHPGGREADIPLRGAQEAANRGEGAAVANRGALRSLLRSTRAVASRFDSDSSFKQTYNLRNNGTHGLHLGEHVADFDELLVQPVERKSQATNN